MPIVSRRRGLRSELDCEQAVDETAERFAYILAGRGKRQGSSVARTWSSQGLGPRQGRREFMQTPKGDNPLASSNKMRIPGNETVDKPCENVERT